MARPIEFEADQALDAAVETFRQQGFAGTSIKTLERATGLSSGSLYNSFGDKDRIFRLALGRYVDRVVARRLTRHLTQGEAIAGLKALFLTLLDEPDGGSFGCLLTNTAVEFGPAEAETLTDLHRGFHNQEEALLAAIERLEPGRTDAPLAARRLLALYQGVLVLMRSGYPKERLREMIAFEFDGLTP